MTDQPKYSQFDNYAAYQTAMKAWRSANPTAWECVALTVYQCNPKEPHFHFRCGYVNACSTCGDELEYAGEFDGSHDVTCGHVGFGDALMCVNGHWFAYIQGALVPASHVLTVIETES